MLSNDILIEILSFKKTEDLHYLKQINYALNSIIQRRFKEKPLLIFKNLSIFVEEDQTSMCFNSIKKEFGSKISSIILFQNLRFNQVFVNFNFDLNKNMERFKMVKKFLLGIQHLWLHQNICIQNKFRDSALLYDFLLLDLCSNALNFEWKLCIFYAEEFERHTNARIDGLVGYGADEIYKFLTVQAYQQNVQNQFFLKKRFVIKILYFSKPEHLMDYRKYPLFMDFNPLLTLLKRVRKVREYAKYQSFKDSNETKEPMYSFCNTKSNRCEDFFEVKLCDHSLNGYSNVNDLLQ